MSAPLIGAQLARPALGYTVERASVWRPAVATYNDRNMPLTFKKRASDGAPLYERYFIVKLKEPRQGFAFAKNDDGSEDTEDNWSQDELQKKGQDLGTIYKHTLATLKEQPEVEQTTPQVYALDTLTGFHDSEKRSKVFTTGFRDAGVLLWYFTEEKMPPGAPPVAVAPVVVAPLPQAAPRPLVPQAPPQPAWTYGYLLGPDGNRSGNWNESLSILPDDTIVSDDHTNVGFWKLVGNSWKMTSRITVDREDHIGDAAAFPDGQRIARGAIRMNQAIIWKRDANSPEGWSREFEGVLDNREHRASCTVSTNGDIVLFWAYGVRDIIVVRQTAPGVWTRRDTRLLAANPSYVRSVAALTGGRFACSTENGTVYILSRSDAADAWNEVPIINGPANAAERRAAKVTELADGRLAIGFTDGKIEIGGQSARTGAWITETILQTDKNDAITALAAFRDGRLASGTSEGDVVIWRRELGRWVEEATLDYEDYDGDDGDNVRVSALATLRSGRLAVIYTNDEGVPHARVWSPAPLPARMGAEACAQCDGPAISRETGSALLFCGQECQREWHSTR